LVNLYWADLVDSKGHLVVPFQDGRLTVTVGAPVKIRAADGPRDALPIRYSLDTGGHTYQLGTHYLDPFYGMMVDQDLARLTPTDGTPASNEPYFRWSEGLPDLFFAVVFAGKTLNHASLAMPVPSPKWDTFHAYGSHPLTWRLAYSRGLAAATLQPTFGPITRAGTTTVAFDSSCAFPASMRTREYDGTTFEAKRLTCKAGQQTWASSYGQAGSLPDSNPLFTDTDGAKVGSQLDGASFDGYSLDDARRLVEQSTQYSSGCASGCQLMAAKFSIALKPAVVALLPPTLTLQWGFWYWDGQQQHYWVAERSAMGDAVSTGRGSDPSPVPVVHGPARAIRLAPISAAWDDPFGPGVPFSFTWTPLPTAQQQGGYLQLSNGTYDQTATPGQVNAQVNLLIQWSANRQGYLGDFAGNFTPEVP
jgi:hypothetical protein